jgi:DnaJ-class molecular chaperone
MTKDEALRLALEALGWTDEWRPRGLKEEAITAIKAALEAKDEPVACGACNGSGRMVRDPDIGTDQECFVCEGSGVFEDTTPPQRTWVGLTLEELDAIYAGNEGTRTRRQIYQAIEAKLKEKNT